MINVMIVEDDPMVAEFNRRYLEQIEGFQLIASVRSADEALQCMEKQKIDLLLLDIAMPGMTGVELLERIRMTGHDVDVIIVSAASDIPTIKKVLRHGVVDFLIKPFEFDRLNNALSDYRNQTLFMRNREAVNQNELDKRLLGKEQTEQIELAKGLGRNTLKAVWEEVRLEKQPFTTEEMAQKVGITRVSMRKYLDFLKQIDIVSMDVLYGNVGRPVYNYRCINPDSQLIKRYL